MIKFYCIHISWDNIKTNRVIGRGIFNYSLSLSDAFRCNPSIAKVFFYENIFYPSNVSASIANTQETHNSIRIHYHVQLIISRCPVF